MKHLKAVRIQRLQIRLQSVIEWGDIKFEHWAGGGRYENSKKENVVGWKQWCDTQEFYDSFVEIFNLGKII